MNVKGNTKDIIKTRLDLQAMNIRTELHPIQSENEVEVPTACYTLSLEEKHKLCIFLKNLKVPDGFSSNISQCVNLKEHKISSLKSHDCHVLLQYILPLALRGMLSKEVCEPLIELSLFFCVLGSKELRIDELKHIKEQIPITLCKLEKVFPPSFFDVMVYLPIHLAGEAKIAGLFIIGGWHVQKFPLQRSTLQMNLSNTSKKLKQKVLLGKKETKGITGSTMCSGQVMGKTMRKNSMVRENEYMQVDTLFSLSTNQVKQRTKEAETSSFGKERGKGLTGSTMCSGQVMGITMRKNSMGGKDGNPPDLGTIFYETRKKGNKLVEPEAIEKHVRLAQIEEIVKAESSLPTIEIVEKCWGPQNLSHVICFGGGVKAKDMKEGTSSKTELLSALHST
ncbi:hypothetical protein FXO38_12211 [Capsicum annuum]|nr:hypothetical protein FXO38_12211 [Capsicum annuum]